MTSAVLILAAAVFPATPAWSLDAIPLYEPVSIGGMIRSAYPSAGISSAAALNEQGDTVGRAVIDNQYHAFIYTEEGGVRLLPPVSGFSSHVAVDLTDRDLAGEVVIVGSAQTLYGDPDRAVAWVYHAPSDVVLDTVDIGRLPGTDMSTAAAINNKGLIVGYSRASGWLGPYEPMVFDVRTGTLHALDVPFNPVDINAADVITGGTYRAALLDDGGMIAVATLEDLSTPVRPGVSRTTALNDVNEVVGVTSMGYTDGAGRMVAGAVRFKDGIGWEVLWANSAYDSANDLNVFGDVVGSIGISSAIRPYLYIEALQAGFLLNDLVDPSFPGVYADYGANAISDNGSVAGGASGAVLFKRIGDMPPPTAPANVTVVPHEPTWQQPWNALTVSWENTSALTRSYTVERSVSGTDSWIVIKANWINTQLWDTQGELCETYDYRVMAEGLAGLSPPSVVATGKFPCEPVDTTPPLVVISSPADGAVVSGTVSVSAVASDNKGLTYMELSYANNMTSGQLCATSPGGATSHTLTCNWNTRQLDPGTYTVEAFASDAMGNGVYDVITVTVGEPQATTLTSQISLKGPSHRDPSVSGVVTIVDATGTAVRSVIVTATWTGPDGSTQTPAAVYTDRKGKAKFSTAFVGVGDYTLTINSVTKSGYTFDSEASELSDSINVTSDGGGKGGKGGNR